MLDLDIILDERPAVIGRAVMELFDGGQATMGWKGWLLQQDIDSVVKITHR